MDVVSEAQGNGLENDPQIKGKAPVVNVPQVEFHSVLDILHFLDLPTISIHLTPASYPWFHLMTQHIAGHQFCELISMLQHVWSRPNNTHVPKQNIDELRCFIQAGLSHDVPPSRNSFIPLGSL